MSPWVIGQRGYLWALYSLCAGVLIVLLPFLRSYDKAQLFRLIFSLQSGEIENRVGDNDNSR